MKRIVQISFVLGLAVFAAAMLAFQIHEIPTVAKIKKSFLPSVRIVVDRDGQIIDQVQGRQNPKYSRLPWIDLTQVPPRLRDLLRKSEGHRLGYRTSALVQKAIGRGNSWLKTLALQMAWKDEQILEAFVNLSVFNGNMQGLNAASFALFDKPALEMDQPETALVVSLLHHRLGDTEGLRKEACRLLGEIGSQEACALLSAQHLNYLAKSFSIQPYMKMAPHIARELAGSEQLREQVIVRSTIDRNAQWSALHALQSGNQNGAIVAMENNTGDILVYVGNIGATAKTPYVDGTMEAHPAGSMLKPFAFAQALDEHIVTLNTGLETSPSASAPNMVSVRKALAANLNVPSVKVLELVGADSFVRLLKQLGFAHLERAGFYGPSLVLGSADVRLLELTNAYRALANFGQWSPARLSPDLISELAPKKIFSKATAYLIGDILNKNSHTGFWSARQCLENWCVGYSEKFTVGVWSEGRAAGDIWSTVMNHLQQSEKSEAPMAPAGLTRLGNEWFIKGTEPVVEMPGRLKPLASYKSRISFPLDRSLIAVGPDVNKKKSPMFIQVVAPRADQNLYLNGRRLGRAQTLQPWEPESGRYRLELRDSQGQVLDKVQFVVRGRRFAQNL